ncbi:MAG: KEOPS complex subunit Cgi121 [Candidatus Helarchaeota archaeon]
MYLKKFEDTRLPFQYCGITAFKSITLPSIPELFDFFDGVKNKSIIQCFNCSRIASWEHVFFAALHAISSHELGKMISMDLGMEFLLHASGQRQIKVAKSRLGVKEDFTELGLVVIGNDHGMISLQIKDIQFFLKAEEDETLLELTEPKKKQIMADFKIDEKELLAICPSGETQEWQNALLKIVLNRMAMLILDK